MRRFRVGFPAVVRAAGAVLAALLVACGGGGSRSAVDVPQQLTLTATALNGHDVALQWSGLASAPTNYAVYMDGAFLWTELPSGPSETTGRTVVRSLAASTRHCFVVYAVYFPLGIQSRSNEACATTFADAPPGEVSGVVATAVTPARIDLAWTAAVDDWGIAQYRVNRDGNAPVTVTATQWSDTSVVPAHRYCYTVTAIDTGGNASPPSAAACGTTPADGVAPTAPAFLEVTVSGTVATLRWGASGDDAALAGYRLLRDGALLREIEAPPGPEPVVATDADLAAATQVCYAVVAVDRAGNVSPPSPRACATTSWTFSVLAARADVRDAIGTWTAAAIDAAGRLHVAHSFTPWSPAANAPGPTGLHYLTNAGGAWVTTPVPMQFALAAAPAVAVRNGTVHLAYRDSGLLRYATLGAAPTSETIGSESPREIGLGIDAAGPPQLGLATATVRHGVRSASGWTFTDVSAVTPMELSFAVDRQGKAHFAFRDSLATTLWHATDAGGAWTVTALATGAPGTFFFPRIAVDAAGAAHIVYHDEPNATLKYATARGGAWTHAGIDTATVAGPGLAIAVDPDGAVHVSASDRAFGGLKYLTNRSGAWRTFVLQAGSTPAASAVLVDAAGRVHIVFGGADLRLATGP